MIKSGLIIFLLLVFLRTSGQPAGSFMLTSSANFENININNLSRLQKNWLEKIYYSSVAAPNELVSGKEYQPYFWRSGTNPQLFYKSNRSSTLFLKAMQFRNLSLQYDTYLDEVIYTDNNRMVNGRLAQIALNKDNIQGFNLYFDNDSLLFRHIIFSEKDSKMMKDGYYEVAYDGKTRFLIRHRSTLYNKEGLDKYEYSPERYILSGDVWVKITSKKSFLKIFGDREKEINGILNKSKIKIPKANRNQITEILKYYDSSLKSGN